jgi:hypothetical protein
LYTIEKSIAAGIFYAVAKSRVKDIEALKWICLTSIGQSLLSPICDWAIVKQPLHFKKIKNFLEEKKLNYLLSLAESSFLLALSLAPTIVTGLIKKDLKTAIIAFVVLDILNRRLASVFFNPRVLFFNPEHKKYYEIKKEESRLFLECMASGSCLLNPAIEAYIKASIQMESALIEKGIKYCEFNEWLREELEQINILIKKYEIGQIDKNECEKEVKSRKIQIENKHEEILSILRAKLLN